MAHIGQFIDGKFEILQLIGRGGMSRVYLARDIHLGKKWVVKEIPGRINGEENALFMNAALSEAQIIMSLDHPSIVRIVDIFRDDQAVYIVEDYVQGKSLREITDSGGLRDAQILKDWSIQLCRILIYLHSRKPPVIYRDIKPENIILTDSGHLKLIDFGIARRYRKEKDRDTVYLGTVQYAAPEQYEEYRSQTDARTDIYGFGKTLEYLAAQSPGISDPVREVIQRCTRERPEERYQSAEELLQTLERIGSFRKRGPGRKILAGLLTVLFGTAAILLWRRTVDLSVERQMTFVMDQIAECGEDGIFSQEEEEQLLNLIVPHLEEWREKEGFAEMMYQMGSLYWNDYEYGRAEHVGAREAVRWFELAENEIAEAKLYLNMGSLQTDMDMTDPVTFRTGSGEEMFEKMFLMLNQAETDTIPYLLKLDACFLAAECTARYITLFQKDGIEGSDVQSLILRIRNCSGAATELSPAPEMSERLSVLLDQLEEMKTYYYGESQADE
ncbi:MAG: serine/threonine protein kinase [Parasporobacterium sp.]|nr:serine/threonine protein kinase [Parasporobacterium sp.]